MRTTHTTRTTRTNPQRNSESSEAHGRRRSDRAARPATASSRCGCRRVVLISRCRYRDDGALCIRRSGADSVRCGAGDLAEPPGAVRDRLLSVLGHVGARGVPHAVHGAHKLMDTSASTGGSYYVSEKKV